MVVCIKLNYFLFPPPYQNDKKIRKNKKRLSDERLKSTTDFDSRI